MNKEVEFPQKYQTFLPRLGALMIDSFIMIPLEIFSIWFREANFPNEFFYFWIPLSALVFPVYSIWMNTKFGQTLGKMAMYVKILTAEKEEEITFKHAILRDIPQILFTLFSIVTGIAALSLGQESDQIKSATSLYVSITAGWVLAETGIFLTNQKRRALHDFIAGTVVVRLEKPERQAVFSQMDTD